MDSVVALKPKVTLGGSTAAAAAGIDPYLSRVMLWAELTGRVERLPSEAMAWGNRLQPLIIEALGDMGYGFGPLETDGRYEYRDDARPWLVGHPDGSTMLDGEPALLEVKTAGPFTGKWSDDPPVHYVAQCHVYMHLTGLRRALLACLVGGQRLELRTVDFDEHACSMLLRLMEDFMGYVERDEPPPPRHDDHDAMLALYPSATPERVYRLTQAEYRRYGELVQRREQAKALDAQVSELENVLKAAMGDAETAISPHDVPVLHWRNTRSTRLDGARLKAERPDLHAEYLTTTDTRRFTLA